MRNSWDMNTLYACVPVNRSSQPCHNVVVTGAKAKTVSKQWYYSYTGKSSVSIEMNRDHAFRASVKCQMLHRLSASITLINLNNVKRVEEKQILQCKMLHDKRGRSEEGSEAICNTEEDAQLTLSFWSLEFWAVVRVRTRGFCKWGSGLVFHVVFWYIWTSYWWHH